MTLPLPPEQQPEPEPTDPAFISADDQERAKLRFREVAPKNFRDILDAEPDDRDG